MQKIKYLKTICDQNMRLEAFFDEYSPMGETVAQANHALSMASHLLDELAQPQYNSAYIEAQLPQLVASVDEIVNSMQTVYYRGISAEICKGTGDYSCKVTDCHGNDLRWFIDANSMTHAIAKAERYFDAAIACLRGFCTTDEFYGRMNGYCV